jgi:hypothetical protein
MSVDKRQQSISAKTNKWTEWVAVAVATVGFASAVFSFFPHITVSEPVQMDPTDLFSYQITVTNDGVLPIFGVKWAPAPRNIKIGNNNQRRGVKLIAPHYDWMAAEDLMALVTKTGAERHAVIMFQPGGEMVVD